MMPCLYIDSGFFDFLFEKLSRGVLDESFDGINKIRKFIYHPDVNVVFEADRGIKSQIVHDYIRVKGGRITEGKSTIAFEEKETTHFHNEVLKIGSRSPFSICFSTTNNSSLQHTIEELGYYYIGRNSISDFLSIPFISIKNVFRVNQSGDIRSWEDLKNLSHNFNSLVILDRYLFSKNNKTTHSKFRETVAEIISNLTCKNNSKVIEILLVSVKSSGGDVGYTLKEIKEAVEQELTKKNINKKISISIARSKQITDINHDRIIFTNFCALFSGNSFNYFENSTLKTKVPTIDTTLNVFSILDVDNWKSYYQMMRLRKKELPTKEDRNIPNEDLQEGNIDIEFLKLL